MAERSGSLVDRLDQAVQALLAYPDAALPPADARLAPLLRIAAGLRDLPREEFRARLKADLERRAVMTTSAEPEQQATKAVQPALHTITSYLTAPEAPELIAFVKQAFGAEELHRATGSAGGIHCSVRIGDSTLMIGGGPMPGGGEWRHPPNTAAIHLYVKDADAVYRRALAAGATSIGEPVDQPYGDREAGVKDAAGNHWYIATHKATGYIPEGLRDLTPYLHPRGADKLIDFLKQAFGAEEAGVYRSPEGSIAHAKVRIGDSVVEMGEAHGEFQPMPSMFYLYMENVDAVYQRALEAGATSIEEPANTPYGHRRAGVKDPFGNDWYIAMEIKHA